MCMSVYVGMSVVSSGPHKTHRWQISLEVELQVCFIWVRKVTQFLCKKSSHPQMLSPLSNLIVIIIIIGGGGGDNSVSPPASHLCR